MADMDILIITRPGFYPGEADDIGHLMRAGLRILHLRKPEATSMELEELLRQIPAEWHRRITLHGSFELIERWPIGGVHLNRRNPLPPAGYRGRISRSCHTLEEVAQWKPRCRYVFLSPIYDSVSKAGYRSAFTLDTLRQAQAEGIIDHRVVALGGISLERLPQVHQLGFGGAALLGDVWRHRGEELADYFRHLQACAHGVTV